MKIIQKENYFANYTWEITNYVRSFWKKIIQILTQEYQMVYQGHQIYQGLRCGAASSGLTGPFFFDCPATGAGSYGKILF